MVGEVSSFSLLDQLGEFACFIDVRSGIKAPFVLEAEVVLLACRTARGLADAPIIRAEFGPLHEYICLGPFWPCESSPAVTYLGNFQLRIALALSPRILAYLARKATREAPTMALTVVTEVEHPPPPLLESKEFKSPPPVITTPCDPWPRPYFLEEGLRKVHPYHYTYNTYCKERWREKELIWVFSTEFRDRPLEYYVRILFRVLTRLFRRVLICFRKMP